MPLHHTFSVTCRWLDAANAKSLAQHQLPFGSGQRACLGRHLAHAEMTAVLSELGRRYTLHARDDPAAVQWRDFPIKQPVGGLHITLRQREAAAGTI